MKTVLLSCLLVLLSASLACAQVTPVDTAKAGSYYILLKDGSHIHGRIVRRDSTMMTVRMRNGQLTYVERELFQAVSGVAPAPAEQYYTQETVATRPSGATLSPSQYVVTLTDGTTLNGQVLSQDSTRLVLKTTTIGTVYVPSDRVARLEKAGYVQRTKPGSQHPAEGYPNLFPQYLNFTPTAFQAERGRVYYRNSYVYVNQIDAGLSDNWSVGAGLITPFAFVWAGWLSTKVSVPLGPGARVGVQGQYFFGGFNLFSSEAISTNLVQGVLSLGSSQNNVTFGLGKSFGPNSDGALVTVGVVRKASPLLTFISENQLSVGAGNNTPVKLGAGLRFDRQRHSFDVSANVFFGVFGGLGTRSAVGFLPSGSYQLRIGQ